MSTLALVVVCAHFIIMELRVVLGVAKPNVAMEAMVVFLPTPTLVPGQRIALVLEEVYLVFLVISGKM